MANNPEERRVPEEDVPNNGEAPDDSVATSNGGVGVYESDMEATTDVSTQIVSVEINDF